MDNEKAKNYIKLSEKELTTLLQLMFELGTHYNKFSKYDFDSYTKKFHNKFSSKRGLQLLFFLETAMTLDQNKLYKPNELNRLISNNFRNFIPSLLNNLGLITDKQFISIKKDSNLIIPRELTELLQIMVDDLKILEKVSGIKKIKKIEHIQPGRKDNTKIINDEGYPSRYRLTNEFIITKNLFKDHELLLILRNFINNNQSLKNYLIFNLNTIYYNTSELLNKKLKPVDKERLRNELNKKLDIHQENFIQILYLLLLFSNKEEIKNLSNIFMDSILSTNDYTYILFLIKLFGLINKL